LAAGGGGVFFLGWAGAPWVSPGGGDRAEDSPEKPEVEWQDDGSQGGDDGEPVELECEAGGSGEPAEAEACPAGARIRRGPDERGPVDGGDEGGGHESGDDGTGDSEFSRVRAHGVRVWRDDERGPLRILFGDGSETRRWGGRGEGR